VKLDACLADQTVDLTVVSTVAMLVENSDNMKVESWVD